MSEVLYNERLQRVNDALALNEPDHVPIAPQWMSFPFHYAGYTMAEVNYDVEKAQDAIRKYLNHFQPDITDHYAKLFIGQFPMLEKYGVKWLQWAGQKNSIVPDDSIFQFVEKEYMTEDEYPELLGDQSGFVLRKYLTRTTTLFEPFESTDFPSMIGYAMPPGALQFMNPDIAEAFETLGDIGRDMLMYYYQLGEFCKELEEMGFPLQVVATTVTAYDYLSDFLRGTIGLSMDLMEQPENVHRAVEAFYPGTLKGALIQTNFAKGRFVFIPLHKGMDGFLSDTQYKKYYWDTLLRLVNDLIENGLTPWIYTEGPYDSRVECLMDVPKGKTWIHFETADMKRVKKLLGDVACLSGGISSTMLMYGSREEVISKTKENVDILAPGGGYIFDLGDTMENCKPELVEVMFDTVRQYGKYK